MRKLIVSTLIGIVATVGATDLYAYNRLGLSYNNTHYSYNKDMNVEDANFSSNGIGLNYIHGFKVSPVLPMYVEAGLNANFEFSSKKIGEIGHNAEVDIKQKFQNINFQVPVNFTYRFGVKGITIAPYVGLNFKLNVSERMKIALDGDADRFEVEYDGEWVNLLSKDDMGDDGKWNTFQMGWHVGVGGEFKKIYLGLQYGTDFIPAFSYKADDFHGKINTGNFRLTLGYSF